MSSPYVRQNVGGHASYGSANLNGQLHPIWEGAGVFAARALGPIVRSNGYPSPATLPASIGGGAGGYGSSQSGWNWGLFAGLLVLSVIGVLIVHHKFWRA